MAGVKQIVIEQGSSSLGTWLTFVGALLVATVAAVTAHARLQRQLDAESDRLIAHLDAEQTRLDAQLIHDRLLHDLGEYREVLDKAAADLWDLVVAWGDLAPRIQKAVVGQGADPVQIDLARREEDLLKAWKAVLEPLMPLSAHLARLTIRFGRDHPVSESFVAAWDAFAQMRRHQAWPVEAHVAAAMQVDLSRATECVNAFLREAKQVAGAAHRE